MNLEITERSWLEGLLIHDERVEILYPMDKRVILFNTDTTILYIRHVSPFLLRSFDQKTRFNYLSFLKAAQVGGTDASSDLCQDLPLSFDNKEATLMWYLNDRQRAEAVIDS